MTNYNYFVDISSCFFLVFLIGTALFSVSENIIDWLNSDKGNLSKRIKELHLIHPLMKKFFTRGKIMKSQQYHSESDSFGDFHSSIHNSFSTLCFLCGLAPFILHSIIKTFPSWSISFHYIAFFLIVSLCKTLIDIPFQYYDNFVIETKYGFNKMTKKTFIQDIISSFALTSTITSFIVLCLNWSLTSFGYYSPFNVLCLVGGFILFGFVMEFLSMTVFIRIFNKLTPLKNKRLKSKIDKLLISYGYNPNRVFVMDGSKRSSKSNAFIGGIGKSKKIVLFDTLLKNYSDSELIAILGHELAHGKLGHLFINRMMSAFSLLIMTFVTFSFIYNVNLYHAFGFNWVTEENVLQYSLIGFNLALLVIGSVKWVLSPISSYISRKMEYAADRYSVKYTNKKDAMISSLIKLTSENFGDIFPNKFYEMWNYSHPSLINRIRSIQELNYNT